MHETMAISEDSKTKWLKRWSKTTDKTGPPQSRKPERCGQAPGKMDANHAAIIVREFSTPLPTAHLAIVQVVAQKLLLLQRLQRVQRLLYCQVSSLAPHGLLTVGVCNLQGGSAVC